MIRFVGQRALVALLVFGCSLHLQAQRQPAAELLRKFQTLSDTTTWRPVARVPLQFPAHHPQGMARVGSNFFMSSVEVLDRAAGRGVGHLFKFDVQGTLLADVKLGEGARYHPGGIDYDGEYLWVPVAEYRPHSSSIVYKVHAETLKITEVLRFDDHLGGLVHNTDTRSLHALSWGSRTYYRWQLDAQGKVPASAQPTEPLRVPNPSFYIDYQDCHYLGQNRMLCGGLKSYRQGTSTFRLGGLDLVDLTTHQPVHQVPLPLWSPSGRPLTQNPFWLKSTPTGLMGYFVPDDGEATLLVYEVLLK
jgi:hypothetical protein